MKKDLINESLIHLMVSETMDSFESSSFSIDGFYNAQTMCVHLQVGDHRLEFPKGFGPFGDFIENQDWSLQINAFDDEAYLLSIFNHITDSTFSRLIVEANQGKVGFRLFESNHALAA
jgi:hypothetical protein